MKAWESLKLRFGVLVDEITNCKQNGQPVGRLSKLLEELQDLKTFRSCTCEAATDIEKEREDARVHKLLFGLDESRFSSIRSQILNEDPLPDSVDSRVIREEQHLLTMRAKEHEAVGFSAQTDSSKFAAPVAAAASQPRYDNKRKE